MTDGTIDKHLVTVIHLRYGLKKVNSEYYWQTSKIQSAPHNSIIKRKSRKNTKEKSEVLKFLDLKHSFKYI